MDSIAALGGLNCIYFTMLAVGAMYALVILVAGEFHDFGAAIDLPGGDLPFDVLHGEIGVMSLSPITLAGFITAFGAFGLIGLGLFEATTSQSLVWATVGGLVVGIASHLVFITVFIKPQGSSEVRREHLLGLIAEVITPIPEQGVGEIAYVAQGGRITQSARSKDGLAVRRGAQVRIEDIVGAYALISRVEADGSVGTATELKP